MSLENETDPILCLDKTCKKTLYSQNHNRMGRYYAEHIEINEKTEKEVRYSQLWKLSSFGMMLSTKKNQIKKNNPTTTDVMGFVILLYFLI